MLGMWFIAFAVGDAVGGQTGRLRDYMSEPAYFLTLAVIAIVASLVLLVFARQAPRDDARAPRAERSGVALTSTGIS